eukprot:TRINITY_DN11820_c0_g1_i1.p1 TRINITY_DN11820_c0_g1~~TRINITY_DN11820_c0_g1_i1.p1  ORF type:complete len:353 (+),score=24.49 TRINITY_DN11820_c0_g1_i1:55-1059(+)
MAKQSVSLIREFSFRTFQDNCGSILTPLKKVNEVHKRMDLQLLDGSHASMRSPLSSTRHCKPSTSQWYPTSNTILSPLHHLHTKQLDSEDMVGLEEKKMLQKSIENMNSDDLTNILKIVQERERNRILMNGQQLTFDLNQLEPDTLRRLRDYILLSNPESCSISSSELYYSCTHPDNKNCVVKREVISPNTLLAIRAQDAYPRTICRKRKLSIPELSYYLPNPKSVLSECVLAHETTTFRQLNKPQPRVEVGHDPSYNSECDSPQRREGNTLSNRILEEDLLFQARYPQRRTDDSVEVDHNISNRATLLSHQAIIHEVLQIHNCELGASTKISI